VSTRAPTQLPILLVEDSDEDYEALVRALNGAVVRGALHRYARGEEALDYAYGRGRFAAPAPAPRPALILLDLNLPAMDGRELLATIKGDVHLKSIPVIIVTTSHNPHDIAWCYAHGANSYQVKPLDYVEFRNDMRLLAEYWLSVCILPANAEERY
jgi:CheY-like chemotaxis protein